MSETDPKITDEAKPSDSDGNKKAESTSTEPKKAESKKSAKSKPEKKKPEPARGKEQNKSGRGLAVLALLIALIAVLCAGFVGWKAFHLTKAQPQIKAGIVELQSQQSQQQAKLSETIARTQPFAGQINELDQREQRLLSRVDTLSRKVRDLEGTSRSEWQLAEIEYLMRLANQRMLMGTDISSSRNLLNSADQVLAEIDDYSLFPVREALAEDMAALRATTDFDKESTYLRLQSLNSLIPELELRDQHRLKTSMQGDSQSVSIAPEESETMNWQDRGKQILLSIWQEFISLFRINTNRTEPVEILLSTEQEQAVRQNLRLMIEQAKLAVLTRESAIYQNSLEQAQEWLTRYFTPNGEASSAMSKELGELKTLEVAPSLPNINRSLEALKFYRMGLETPVLKPVPAPQPQTPSEDSNLPAAEPHQDAEPETISMDETPELATDNNEESRP